MYGREKKLDSNVYLYYCPSVLVDRTWWRSLWICLCASFNLIATGCGKQVKTILPLTTPDSHQRLPSFKKKTRESPQRIMLKMDLKPQTLPRKGKGLWFTIVLCHLCQYVGWSLCTKLSHHFCGHMNFSMWSLKQMHCQSQIKNRSVFSLVI